MMPALLSTRALPSTGTDPKIICNGVYHASVANINDPQNKGRVQLKIPQVLGTATSNWATPLGIAITNVPSAGTLVYAAFLGGDVNRPAYWTVSSSINTNSLTTKTLHVTSTSEFDSTITLKNGLVTSLITIGGSDAHPKFSAGIEVGELSSPPTTPGTGVKLWADANAKLNFKGSNGLAEFAQAIIIDGALTATGGTASTPTIIETDTWNDMTPGLLNGWTVTSSQVARYRLMPDNSVWIVADLTPGTLTGGTNVWTTPSGPPSYVPASTQPLPCITVSSTAAAQAINAYFTIQAHLQCHNMVANQTRFIINSRYPLD